jgi:hypothetical protein
MVLTKIGGVASVPGGKTGRSAEFVYRQVRICPRSEAATSDRRGAQVLLDRRVEVSIFRGRFGARFFCWGPYQEEEKLRAA